MNQTAKNLIRIAGVVVGLGAAVWALRDQLLPAPEVHPEDPPAFREPASDGDVSGDAPADDLTVIKGIGPVTADKLGDAGITSIEQLAAADPDALAESVGSSPKSVARWVEEAASLV